MRLRTVCGALAWAGDVVGVYHSSTPDGVKQLRRKFHAMILAGFAPEEIRELTLVAEVGMLPADDPPSQSSRT